MNSNPWNVGSIDEFSYLNCPECTFHSKEKTSFKNHATRNHPLSSVLFGTATKVITFSSRNELNQLKQLTSDQKCQDIVSKYNLPDNIQVQSTKKVDASKRNFNDNTNFEKGHGLQKIAIETKHKSHRLKKRVSPQIKIGKKFATQHQEEKINTIKNNFYPSKTISVEHQKFEIETKNQIDFTSKVKTCKEEINNSDIETECNKMDTSISPKMKILSRSKYNLSENIIKLQASLSEIDPLAIEDQEFTLDLEIQEGKESYGCDICNTDFLIKSDFMDHIESVHNESVMDDEYDKSGIVNVKFSTKSPNAAELQALNGDGNLNEQKKNVSILKKIEPDMKKRLIENQEIKNQSLMKEDTDFSEKYSVCNVENAELVPQFDERNEMWKCSICTKKYSTKKHLRRHLLTVHGAGKSQICGKCGRTFDDKKELRGHFLSEHEGKKIFQCSICKASFNHSTNMKPHLVSTHGKKNIMNCKLKELLTMNFCRILEKSQSCDQCGKSFVNKRELKDHILTEHEGKKLFQCFICKASFNRSTNMKPHLVSIHGKKNIMNCKIEELIGMNLCRRLVKSQTCDQCGKKFDNKRDLKGHNLTEHEGKKLYQCSICKASFNDSRNLKKHLVSIHDKNNIMNCKPKELVRMNLCSKLERSQTCDRCEEMFDSERELKGHILSVHEGKKRYRCSICNDSCDSSSKMKIHLISVHKEDLSEKIMNLIPKELLKKNLFHVLGKSQYCDQCDEKFSNESKLKGHVLSVHEGKKLYCCSICKAFFSDFRKMKIHLVSIHGKDNLVNCKPKELVDLNLFHVMGDSQTNKQKEYIVSAPEKEKPLNPKGGKNQTKTANKSENVPIKRKKEKLVESDESNTFEDQNKQEKILHSSVAEGTKTIKCPVCNDSFSTIEQMKSHIGSTHFQLW